MRNILIVAATAAEISEFTSTWDQWSGPRRAQTQILVTGVGMTATAYHLGRALAKWNLGATPPHPSPPMPPLDLILNVGIAGSFDRTIAVGSLVQIIEDRFSELGAEDRDRFLPIEALGFGQSVFRSGIAVGKGHAILDTLPTVNGITVNRVHGNEASIRDLLERHPDAQVESMEGAAVFYAAQESGIPAIQVRAISNYVEPRNRDTWQIAPAIRALNSWLVHFIESIIP